MSVSRSTWSTWWPRPRSAVATCAPERSDTSRSAERPPCSTAIRISRYPRVSSLAVGPAPDPLHLRLQPDAEALAHLGLRPADEAVDVGGGGAPVVDDEVGVQRRELGGPLAHALEARRLDQPAGRVARRAPEHAAAVPGADRQGPRPLRRPARHLPAGGGAAAGAPPGEHAGEQRPPQGPGARGRRS